MVISTAWPPALESPMAGNVWSDRPLGVTLAAVGLRTATTLPGSVARFRY